MTQNRINQGEKRETIDLMEIKSAAANYKPHYLRARQRRQERARASERNIKTNKTMRSAQINKWKWKSSHAPEIQSKTDSLLFLIRGKWIAHTNVPKHRRWNANNNTNGNLVLCVETASEKQRQSCAKLFSQMENRNKTTTEKICITIN